MNMREAKRFAGYTEDAMPLQESLALIRRSFSIGSCQALEISIACRRESLGHLSDLICDCEVCKALKLIDSCQTDEFNICTFHEKIWIHFASERNARSKK